MAQCPNCGDLLPDLLDVQMMAVCKSCQTTVYRLEDRLIQAGSAGEMHDAPLLVGLGDEVWTFGRWYRAVGHARFSYGSGWWDELWLQDEGQNGCWLSLDEGDVIIQTQIPAPEGPIPSKIGEGVSVENHGYTLTESETAKCIAFRGVLPETMAIGDTFTYANFSAHNGHTLSRESQAGSSTWYLGSWIDPFDLKVRRI
ncbi:MAG: DUF4178 domain-containing protein [Roseobacter sp.]